MKHRSQLRIFWPFCILLIATPAFAQQYDGWADKFTVGVMKLGYGPSYNMQCCGIFGSESGGNVCGFGNYGAYLIAGMQNTGTNYKKNSVAKVSYYLYEHDHYACAQITRAMRRYAQQSQYATGNYCNTTQGLSQEDSASFTTDTCGWGFFATTDTVDWPPLELSHATSSPSSGIAAYVIKMSMTVNPGVPYSQDGWTCYKIKWL